jgi:methionyl-tRNA formyltransferase
MTESIVAFAMSAGMSVHIICAPRQAAIKTAEGKNLGDRLAEMGAELKVVERLGEDVFTLANSETIALCFGYPFEITAKLVESFGGRIINTHFSRLPEGAGGGGFSWPILFGARRGTISFHLMLPGERDNGPIIQQIGCDFPKHVRFPIDYDAHCEQIAVPALIDLLDRLGKGERFSLRPQDRQCGTFWPRLDTSSQAYIDWGWHGEEIERFVLAFSAPFSGAMTFVGKRRKLTILDCRFEPNHNAGHPFSHGLVFHKTGGKFHVSCAGGLVLINEKDLKSNPLPDVGDRLFTPRAVLEQALELHPGFI